VKDQFIVIIEQLLKGLEGADKKKAEKTLLEAYEGLTAQYRPIMAAIPGVLPKVAKDIVPLVVAIAKSLTAIKKDTLVVAAVKEYREVAAKDRRAYIKVYTEAGFSPDEAFALLMLDSANMKTGLANVKLPINKN